MKNKDNDLTEIKPEDNSDMVDTEDDTLAAQDALAAQSDELEEANSMLSARDEEIEKLKADLADKEKQLMYGPKPGEIPENQKQLPDGIQEADIKTTVRNLSSIIKEKMMQINDLATTEVLIDSHVRMRNRLESVKKMGSAEHIKIRGVWKTIAPKMHISNLQGKKISNDEFEITFGVFDVDEKNNKKLYVHYTDVLLHDGSSIKRPTAAEYKIAYEVVERIRTGKGITREVVKIGKIQD